MNGPMCRKGKSCGATCIDARERCNIELGPLVSPAVSKVATNLGAIFMRGIEAGKVERLPSVPSDMKRELAALNQPRQLERSPGARTRTAPAVRRELANPIEPANKKSTDLMLDDISRILKGEFPQRGSASGDTRWGRDNASDFDKTFKIYKRIRGDKDLIDWNETIRNGKPIGEGSYGSVLKVGNMAVKRGEVSGEEANILNRVGKAGIGPKLYGAEISTKLRGAEGVDLHRGRIAMSIVPGREMGDVAPNQKINGKNAADIYWKAMADLHRLGIAHNDAHPHNLMVDNKGKGRWVDMGFAQQSPKAALAEALGSFTRSSNERGGNWQTQSWESPGINKYMTAKRVGGFAELRKEYPVFGKVVDNFTDVQQKLMRNYGFSRQEVDQIIDHGIRSDLSSYNKGNWSKITDKQAQDLLNTLYNGI
jgi:hypothetical protein